jgi:hypothetical protein
MLDVNDVMRYRPGEIEYHELHHLQNNFFSELPVLIFILLPFGSKVIRNPLEVDMSDVRLYSALSTLLEALRLSPSLQSSRKVARTTRYHAEISGRSFIDIIWYRHE